MTDTQAFILLAGRPALDLLNTQLCDAELLADPDDLARWFVESGLTDHPPSITRRDVDAARGLREAMRPALMASDGPALAAVAEEWLGRAPGTLCIEPGTLRPRFTPAERTSRCLLVTAVLDALDLVRDTPGRVRECADPACPVVYLDLSRNRSRRWCSMDTCGARSKASAYYRRHRPTA